MAIGNMAPRKGSSLWSWTVVAALGAVQLLLSPVFAAGNALRADFNGDGYQDLVVGMPGKDVADVEKAGAVQILFGSADGVNKAASQVLDLGIPGSPLDPEPGDAFGAVVAAGDFDADGYADLAIGLPSRNRHRGLTLVYYGSAEGLNTQRWQIWHQGPLQDKPERGDRFGAALAVGDFDADGYDDLAIGVPGEDFPDLGPPNGSGPKCRQERGCRDAGVVNLVFGGPKGLQRARNQLWHQDRGESYDGWVEYGDCFGSSLAVGDFDGNRVDDLAVGVTCEHTGRADVPGRNHGAVSTYYGRRRVGLVPKGAEYLRQWKPDVPGYPQPNDAFSYALAACDFDRDGIDDLAVGIPGEGADIGGEPGTGAVEVFYGSQGWGLLGKSGRPARPPVLLARTGPTEGAAGDHWGWALAAGDFNGDGFCDLAVGAPQDDLHGLEDAGSVSLLLGGPEGLTYASQEGDLLLPSGQGEQAGPQANAWFGYTLLAGDFNADGLDDLLVGAPFEDLGEMSDAGAAEVFHGAAVGSIRLAGVRHLQASEAQTGAQYSGRLVPKLFKDPWSPVPDGSSASHDGSPAADGDSNDEDRHKGKGPDRPPQLASIGDRRVEVGATLTFTVVARDDGPRAALRLRALNLPAEAVFSDEGEGRGIFSWTPTPDSRGRHRVTFIATDRDGTGRSARKTVTITVVPAAGAQAPWNGSPAPIPGRIEMENYDLGGEGVAYHDGTSRNRGGQYRDDAVDIWYSRRQGFYVGGLGTGEWLEFTVDVAKTGHYAVDVHYTTPKEGRRIRLELDGIDVSGEIVLPGTGGWHGWQTVRMPVELTGGRHVLRVVIERGGLNMNWLRFVSR
ncbi:MAG TPA: carbohydrate-binding protein [Thiotrichales bacterium]|nr:carbohydrate-binding protein [Thiotrichales bacterium]